MRDSVVFGRDIIKSVAKILCAEYFYQTGRKLNEVKQIKKKKAEKGKVEMERLRHVSVS